MPSSFFSSTALCKRRMRFIVYNVMEPGDYYVTEVSMAGYRTEYTNVASSVTDRALNGGVITNMKIAVVPETGNHSTSLRDILLLAGNMIGLVWIGRGRKMHKQRCEKNKLRGCKRTFKMCAGFWMTE